MANAITSSAQLSTFSTIKSILMTSTVLNTKFATGDYYEFEPNLKAGSFSGYPYIVINTPSLSNPDETFEGVSFKVNQIIIELVVEYSARSNFVTYANAIIDVIESNESTLESVGLYNTKIEFDDTSEEYVSQKQMVRGTFTLTHDGYVTR